MSADSKAVADDSKGMSTSIPNSTLKPNSTGAPKLRLEDRVIIRIWSPAGGVGHVSIQTANRYMSLWPKNHPGGKLLKFFETREADFKKNVEEDELAEGSNKQRREAETIICLYCLNQEAIADKFDELKRIITGWTLLGSNRLINNGNAESCASLALRLLDAGGFRKFLSSQYSIQFSSSITPVEIAEAVIEVKMRELQEYPEVLNFTFEHETEVSIGAVKTRPHTCVML